MSYLRNKKLAVVVAGIGAALAVGVSGCSGQSGVAAPGTHAQSHASNGSSANHTGLSIRGSDVPSGMSVQQIVDQVIANRSKITTGRDMQVAMYYAECAESKMAEVQRAGDDQAKVRAQGRIDDEVLSALADKFGFESPYDNDEVRTKAYGVGDQIDLGSILVKEGDYGTAEEVAGVFESMNGQDPFTRALNASCAVLDALNG